MYPDEHAFGHRMCSAMWVPCRGAAPGAAMRGGGAAGAKPWTASGRAATGRTGRLSEIRPLVAYCGALCRGGLLRVFSGFFTGTVSNDGKFRSVCMGEFGDTRTESFEEMWRGEKARRIRRRVRKCKSPCLYPCWVDPDSM